MHKVTLRPLKPSDAPIIYSHLQHKDVSRWTVSIPHPYKKKDATTFIQLSQKKRKKKQSYIFAIAIPELVGIISIDNVDWEDKHAEIGYWLAKPYWQKGIMTEAINQITRIAFNKLKLHRIQANVFESNLPSQRVLEKNGFHREGHLREVIYRYKNWHNILIYGKIASKK
jgi:RimJ/RimL family protein N-acetyltransferase